MLDEYVTEHVARQRLADLRRSAAVVRVVAESKRDVSRPSWREALGLSLIRLGRRLARHREVGQPRLVRRPAA